MASFVFLLFLLAGAATGAETKKIILDTDLAGDIDDAFAHALVQGHPNVFVEHVGDPAVSPELDVLGITLCDGPTDRRARVSCRMLYECGQERIPVAVGRPTRPNDSSPLQLIWGDGFEKLQPVKESAADFIIRMLRAYPGQVTIISVGPVTNLADVIEKNPAAWKMVKEVYAMFGSFFMGYNGGPVPDAEWNVRADVESAKKFMNSGVPITLAGLDVTTMVKYTEEWRTKLFQRRSPLTDAVSGLYTLWAGDRSGVPNVCNSTRWGALMHADPTFFDPVAVSMALGAGFVTTRAAHVRVTDDGYTVVDETRPPNCRIGMHIDREAFLRWLTGRLVKQNLMRRE